MRTITLEILRHGDAHNQLLSPLTEYLALCGNHGAETLTVPFEHNQLLHRLRALSYRTDEEERRFQLTDTARELGELLSGVKGLNSDLSRHRVAPDAMLHLRLVISASELALLPFELSTVPANFLGTGEWLLLQNELPVCLTREVRRDRDNRTDWGKPPKILFIVAQPPGVGGVPYEAHLLALRREVDPWINAYDDEDARKKQIDAMLTVLPEATAEQIEKTCAGGNYTHIHILAHGQRYQEGEDYRFGLALHPPRAGAPPDIVEGQRLAKALRAVKEPGWRALANPCVVTLACCDAGNVGSVAGVGASVAHALHADGIPMVVASQFPLTFAGSILMVETLYHGFLRGLDPRMCLNNLRRKLRTQIPNSHDWASIVAYAALPADYDAQLIKIQIERAKAAIESVLKDADNMLTKRDGEDEKRDEFYEQKIDRAKEMLRCILHTRPDAEQAAVVYRLLASTEKREAQIYHRQGKTGAVKSREAMERSLEHYREFSRQKPALSWPIHQILSISLALGRKQDLHGAMWLQALGLAQAMVERGKDEESFWACTDLIEIFLLACDTSGWKDKEIVEAYLEKLETTGAASVGDRAKAQVVKYIEELRRKKSHNPFVIEATLRQIARYRDWLAELDDSLLKQLGPIAGEMHDLLKP